ncbi:sensor histidine kinase [Desulfobacter hydrogenophilus]|uniref:histidine kinase n=1 Tax=Desulfobacter hydrogenophilus TaxID=2291 RepID=A0A328FAD2_9BACT|nr:HAMP domain-containing histidine kinase [Desulfobacter hydrogenophilus]NDY73333.1 HAMP domain-containing histidine kinase [Desulfobacter hydrogenophilus]QBH14062.1 HAMP domain-containing histidine kinase [Desulfobacter hydrogenophilus]RAM01624.1 sensor histidine kinase [Desulfobacter hydrogenophilus]
MKYTAQEITDQCGPAYFGRMGAAISHDIKNCLAIMNENAGLMSDHLMMAQKGVPLDTERFSGIVQRIEKQIGRADGIVKSLNTFSHSMDKPEQQIDLDEALELALGLGAKIIANKGIKVDHTQASGKLYVNGSLFFLLFLIWAILENVTENLASGAVLNISSKEDENNQICLSFQCEQPFASNFDQQANSQALDLFQAKIVLDDQYTKAELVFGK